MCHRWRRYLSLATLSFENDQLQRLSSKKIFLGFSDTTMNHLMLHKLESRLLWSILLADICELDKEMLAYSLHYFKELIETGRISEIRPSDVWYEERTDFSPTAWEHLVSVIQIQVLTCCKEGHYSRGKSSVVASNPLRYL